MRENGISQKARFRSELVPRRESWIVVALSYSLGLAALVALGHFLLSFQSFARQYDEVHVVEQRAAAVQRLADDLEINAGASRLGESIESYRQLLEAGAEPATAGGAETVSTAEIERLTALATRANASPEAVELVERLEREETVAAQAANERLSAAYREAVRSVVVLGTVIFLATFGGGWILLRRSRRLENLLRERTAEIEEVDRSRRLFFAKASHELRTPITTMRGEAEVALADRAMDLEGMRESLEHVVAHASFLSHRIEEMIGLARTADGQLHLEADPIDLRDVVAAAISDAENFAASVEVELRADLPDTKMAMTGDALWLGRALLAIIENALKFSPLEGVVEVTLLARDNGARIEVTDEGPGVTPDELPLIFDAYYQTEAGRQRGGSGLGLAMARWVIEQHRGTASAANIGNLRRQGCRVVLTLPLGSAQ